MKIKIIEEVKKLFDEAKPIKEGDYNSIRKLNVYLNELEYILKSNDNFGDIFNSISQSNLRSWDNCRRVFRRAAYQRNPGSTDLPTHPECKCDICGEDCKGMNCRLCDNSLALNLAFYLSSWGMYRSSFLKKYDHTVHIGAVKILMESRYLPLFDPWLWYNKPCKYKDLVKEVYVRLWNHYKSYAEKQKRTNGNPYNVTDTLITKILLGVYGCIPAYDKNFKKAIRKIGGTANISIIRCNLDTVLDEILKLAHILYNVIINILGSNASWDKCGLYTLMKIVDMILFSLGN